MDANLTVAEIFKKANLSPRGPVKWRTEEVSEHSAGIYVIARVCDYTVGCKAGALPLKPLPPDLELDIESEQQRWLPNEPVVYIGKTDRTIHKRVKEFYRHKCGDTRPHAGGQIVGLLRCDLWVYWSPAPNPLAAERQMILAFKNETGQNPFANWQGERKRIRRSN